jgi:hypothetical protein
MMYFGPVNQCLAGTHQPIRSASNVPITIMGE